MALQRKVTPGIMFPPGYVEGEDFEYDYEEEGFEEGDEDDFSDTDVEMEVPLEIIAINQKTRVGAQGQIVVDLEIELEDMDNSISVDIRCNPA